MRKSKGLLRLGAVVAGVCVGLAAGASDWVAPNATVDPAVFPTREAYVIGFAEAPVVAAYPRLSRQAIHAIPEYRAQLQALQAPRVADIRALGGTVQQQLVYAFNGVIAELTPAQAAAVQRLPGVRTVELGGTFRMDQATPAAVDPRSIRQLLGVSAVHAGGNTGQGVVIAVIDSGIDYTHASFMGPGTTAYYATATAGVNPRIIGDTPGVFPGGPQVIGGFDFVGETWDASTNFTLTPDPDPIDNKQVPSDQAGHGTAVAAAAAGQTVSAGLIEGGIAPGAKLLAYRGCSRITSSCSGVAMINSLEALVGYYAGNPNHNQPGADNPALAAGTRMVINMSIGAAFGNAAVNSISEAARNAVRAGIVVVASAGNNADFHFITGSPGSTDLVLSVAASEPELLTGGTLTVGAPLNATYPLIRAAFGPLAQAGTYGFGLAGPNAPPGVNLACSNPINLNPPPAPNPPLPSLTGRIGIADRGVCEFSEKAYNIQQAGGIFALLVNNAAGAGPFGMAAGAAAGLVTIPTYSIGTAEGAALKSAVAADPSLTGTISPLGIAANVAGGINLGDQISSFSSRGPAVDGNRLKPEITAPGTSIFLANVGTGDQGAPISGTSFSSPITAGAAALVLSAFPTFTPEQVKAALMNTATPTVFASKAAGTLTPISRSGAGRLQVDRAVSTGSLAWDGSDPVRQPALSFGFQAFAGDATLVRQVRVQNLGSSPKTYALSSTLRFANDAGRGVAIAPAVSSITVPAGATGSFDVVATVTASALPGTFPAAAMRHNDFDNPAKLTDIERDGYIVIDGGEGDLLRVPYHMVPKRASDVLTANARTGVLVRNVGSATTRVDVFTLAGVDPVEVPGPVPGSDLFPLDIRQVGFNYVPAANRVDFLVTLAQPISSLRVGHIYVDIDANNDGVFERSVISLPVANTFNFATFSRNNATGVLSGMYFIPSYTNGNVFILPVDLPTVGINPSAQMRFRVRTEPQFLDTGITYDVAPDVGAYRVTLAARVVVPSVPAFVLAPAQPEDPNALLSYTVNTANRLASPSDVGLVLWHNEDVAPRNTTAVQVYR